MTVLERFGLALAASGLPDTAPLGKTRLTVGEARTIVAWAVAAKVAVATLSTRSTATDWTPVREFTDTHLAQDLPAVQLVYRSMSGGWVEPPNYHRLLGDVWYGDFARLRDTLHALVSTVPRLERTRDWYRPCDIPRTALEYLNAST